MLSDLPVMRKQTLLLVVKLTFLYVALRIELLTFLYAALRIELLDRWT